MNKAHLLSAATTGFGRSDLSTVELIAQAANAAIKQSNVSRMEIDGVLCGYSTTFPHLMLANLVSEKLGLNPAYAQSLQVGGATGAAMLMLAKDLIQVGRCETILVVAGENRLSGQSRDISQQVLAQVGDSQWEVPLGASVPAYYALMASEYMSKTGLTAEGLAAFSVLMREHASLHPDAHLKEKITIQDVCASKSIASPLKLLDCCPISDGAVAFVVSKKQGPIVIKGAGQAHCHQHLSSMSDVLNVGASLAAQRAFSEACLTTEQIDYLAIYDSFTITLVMLLEELGFAPRGGAVQALEQGDYQQGGRLPLNLHGGLLSFGHSGVAGGMAHVVEAFRQLTRTAGDRQMSRDAKTAFVHADGGVMSAHVSLILQKEEM